MSENMLFVKEKYKLSEKKVRLYEIQELEVSLAQFSGQC